MLYVWVGFAFVFGAIIGSFINVCVARLPFEKSILWPGSRCGKCLQADPLPRQSPDPRLLAAPRPLPRCGRRSPSATLSSNCSPACAFAGLFYLEIGCNVLDLPFLREHAARHPVGRHPPWQALGVVFGYHAVLLSFLIVVSLCDLNELESR